MKKEKLTAIVTKSIFVFKEAVGSNDLSSSKIGYAHLNEVINMYNCKGDRKPYLSDIKGLYADIYGRGVGAMGSELEDMNKSEKSWKKRRLVSAIITAFSAASAAALGGTMWIPVGFCGLGVLVANYKLAELKLSKRQAETKYRAERETLREFEAVKLEELEEVFMEYEKEIREHIAGNGK